MEAATRQLTDGRARIGSLTAPERAALMVMCNVETFRLDHKGMAEAAGITSAQFTRIKRSPIFQQALLELAMRRMGEKLPAIMYVSVQTALIPGKEGFADRQMLLKMAGFIKNERILRILMGIEDTGEGDDQGTAADRLTLETTRRDRSVEEAKVIVFDGDFENVEGGAMPEPSWGGGDEDEEGEDADEDSEGSMASVDVGKQGVEG